MASRSSPIKKWGEPEQIGAEPIASFLEMYVRFHEEADQQMEEEARAWFAKLEQGDEEARNLWRYFVEQSLAEFKRLYKRLHVEFDYYLGESFYNDKMERVVNELKEKELLVKSDGAYVVSLADEDLPPCLIIKSDGSSIYATRDLATALYRREQLKAEQILYVVGVEQSLHFKQVFSVLHKMGYSWSKQCAHIPFGLMKFEGKKMSTRRGRVVSLEEVLNQAVARARELLEEKKL